MLNWADHEKSFVTSGPELDILTDLFHRYTETAGVLYLLLASTWSYLFFGVNACVSEIFRNC